MKNYSQLKFSLIIFYLQENLGKKSKINERKQSKQCESYEKKIRYSFPKVYPYFCLLISYDEQIDIPCQDLAESLFPFSGWYIDGKSLLHSPQTKAAFLLKPVRAATFIKVWRYLTLYNQMVNHVLISLTFCDFYCRWINSLNEDLLHQSLCSLISVSSIHFFHDVSLPAPQMLQAGDHILRFMASQSKGRFALTCSESKKCTCNYNQTFIKTFSVCPLWL